MIVQDEERTSLGAGSVYDHQRYERRRRVLRWLIHNVAFRCLAKFERVENVENFPAEGAAIVMINHIAFIDPIVVLASLPRNVVPMAKVEVYKYPVWGIFPWIWDVIPVRREELDRRAIRKALQVLEAGEVVLMAPEGTRHPELGEAKGGIAYLGYRGNAAMVPVAVDGTKGFPSVNPARWRQPGAVVSVGRPFRFKQTYGRRPSREVLRQMTDEAMYVLAAMLPEHRRGVYSDLSRATTETIVFA